MVLAGVARRTHVPDPDRHSVRSPLQLHGLSSLTVTTASSAGAVRIDGLGRELAGDLVEQLTATIQATTGDAT